MRFSRRAGTALAVFGIPVLAAVAFHTFWLSWLGWYLVEQQPPFRADMVLVLGGDLRGTRILTAAKLAREGYAPRVLVSGSGPIYGQHESDLAVAWAVANGYDGNLFIKLKFPAQSTTDEAEMVVRELRRLQVKKFILVTSSFHTRRAAHIFRRVAPDLPFRTIASPDPDFTPDGWWKNREGQKVFIGEWTKTFANWLGD